IAPGETSTLDVALINPNLVEFDSLKFRLHFDPEIVEVLDADENNYITQGINIYDGGFHGTMAFDRHSANQVDPLRGTIDYNVGNLTGTYPYPSGTLARVVFRMKSNPSGQG